MFFVHNRFFILKELLELKKDKNWILYKKLIEEVLRVVRESKENWADPVPPLFNPKN